MTDASPDTSDVDTSDGAYKRRNVWLLAIAQALFGSGQTIILTVTALIGATLAENKALATLPLSMQFIMVMVAAGPASMLMARMGRRGGFLVGLGFSFCASVLGAVAIWRTDFWLFMGASVLFGVAAAFAQQYRFAAAEAAPGARRARAISLVLAGGVAAAVIGPQLAAWSYDLLLPAVFAGSYLVMAGLALVAAAVIAFLELPAPSAVEMAQKRRPLSVIGRQPAFIVAVLSSMLGYASMSLVMTATPLAMSGSHTFGETAIVIQWHTLGMFAPSFVTGSLIARFGVLNMIMAGVVIAAGAVTVNLLGQSFWHFWAGLLMIGVAWNFMFVGGTTLLTQVPNVAERARTQGLNDVLVWGTVAMSSLGSGAAFHWLGWEAVNWLILPVVAVVAIANVWLRRHQGMTTAAA